MYFLRTVRIAAIAAFCAVSFNASASLYNARIFNHPDGNASPPPYGLRLDNLYNQTPSSGSAVNTVGGITSFSFDPSDNAAMYIDVSMDGLDTIINISGTAYGGVDDNANGYGYGEGLYEIDFTYRINVKEVLGPDGGWTVTPNSIQNFGTIKATSGITDITDGTTWTFYDETDNSNISFDFLQDEHRLTGSEAAALGGDPYVGRGWITPNSDGSGISGNQDWLFVTPEPASMSLLALGGLMVIRRKKA